ncbi:MAG: phosphoenolpyruvate--protein phosphotransferase [Lachnospiraceae bacterium]|nr:phosphoenolpyruvate--protein phosphotransferase [Lachnospiraceae bacterium]
MRRYKGKTVCGGVTIAKIKIMKKNNSQVKRRKIQSVETEIACLTIAVQRSINQLQELYDKALIEVGETSAAIFEVHQMLLEDEDFMEAIKNMIRTENVNAEYAVAVTGDNFSSIFSNMEDEYMRARAIDIKDISERLIRNLKGKEGDLEAFEDNVIILADDLTPSETVLLDKDKICGFATVKGTTNSHTAILARMMDIPALIGVDMPLNELKDGMLAIIDGFNNELIIEPDEETKKKILDVINEEEGKKLLLNELKGKENITSDGKIINIYANIGSVNDIGYVLENDAGGIGLFRSEFLYLGRDTFPSEAEQYHIYKQAAQMMADKKVIIRTMDIGADKKVDYFNLDKEENPALGYRAIRICIKEPHIFKTQLRALFRAAVYGNISIMYPMITSTWEMDRIEEIVDEVVRELDSEGIQYAIPEQGIMIETPAAVMISDELAGRVDFFSIGTNDLTQYVLAVDMQNDKLDDFYNPHHKAVLDMIRMVVDNGHKKGIWVGICGELGADTSLTRIFVEMGVDELSVAPGEVLKVRRAVRDI